jgi:hypothetical protein
MKKIALSLILPFLLNAADISQAELVSFTAQKYKADYNAQTQENKDNLKKEYQDTQKLLNAISNNVKDDADYKVAKTLLAINVWSQKYAKNIKVSDATLKELYAKEKPKTVPTYNLYNILVSDKKKADEILSNLEKITDKTARLNEFKKQVTLNSQDFISSKKEGSVGWIEVQKLDKNVQEQIKDKKVNDIFLTQVENIGYQIILIDDFKPIREVSFDEAREFLTNLARQQEVIKKIESLIR